MSVIRSTDHVLVGDAVQVDGRLEQVLKLDQALLVVRSFQLRSEPADGELLAVKIVPHCSDVPPYAVQLAWHAGISHAVKTLLLAIGPATHTAAGVDRALPLRLRLLPP